MHKWFLVTVALGVRGVVGAVTVGSLAVSLVAQAATTPPNAGDLL